MGDFQPDAQVNGFDGCSFIALICNKYCATDFAVFSMSQKYTIFFNERMILLTDSHPADLTNIISHQEGMDLEKVIHDFEKSAGKDHLVLWSENLLELFCDFAARFRIIEAAGGVVRNPAGQVLCIFRRGKWDLPKGKADLNEGPGETALREVTEECGLFPLQIIKQIGSTWHIYYAGKERILKKTQWFEMSYEGKNGPVPQEEEDIMEARWFYPGQLGLVLSNTYPSVAMTLKELLEQGSGD
jgi:ADP-ribose pyrophosphatase YjhB (NUDIX family)